MKKNKIKNVVIIVLAVLLIVCIIVIAILYRNNANNEELSNKLDLFTQESISPYNVVEKLKDNGYTFSISTSNNFKNIYLESADSKIHFFKMYNSTSKLSAPILRFSNSNINDEFYYIYGMPTTSSGLSQEEKSQMEAFNSWLFDIGLTECQVISAIDYLEATPLLQLLQ